MRWRVDGADKFTGEECAVILDGDNGPEIEAKAARLSMLVSKCRKASAEDILNFEVPAEEFSSSDSLTSPESRKLVRPGLPDYESILSGGSLLRTIGIVCYIVGFLIIAVGIIALLALAAESSQTEPVMLLIQAAGFFIYGFSVVVFGVLLRMFASIAFAIRDIARNSFR